MDNESFSHQESLELISQMLEKTNEEQSPRMGFAFRYWGICTILVSAMVTLVVYYTGQPVWHALWMIMLLLQFPLSFSSRSKKVHTSSYTDDSVVGCFKTLGILFWIEVICLIIYALVGGGNYFQLMAPLSVILVAFTSAQVWSILKERTFYIISLVVMALGIFFLCAVVEHLPVFRPMWNLIAGGLLGILLLIPGILWRPSKSSVR